MSKKYVYLFSEGNANMRELLGGKGANLAEMTNIGLPVKKFNAVQTRTIIPPNPALTASLNGKSSKIGRAHV